MTAFTILTYHSLDESDSVVSVRPDAFAAQLRTLAALGIRGITLADAVEHREVHGAWPDRAVALTFDDGFANFYENGLPLLAEHGNSATVFLVTGHVGGRNDWAPPPSRLADTQMLRWSEIEEAARYGIEVGAHTRSHPDLTRVSKEVAEEEIRGSRADVEDRLGREVRSFAYPFGTFDRTACDLVKGQFRAACTTVLRRAVSEPLHTLPRVDVYYLRSLHAFERAVTGRLDTYLALRRIGRAVRSVVPL